MRRYINAVLSRVIEWSQRYEPPLGPFDNNYEWLIPAFQKLNRCPTCRKRPQYIWGCLQGVALAKVLGHTEVSVIEFGVAGGRGLLALECISKKIGELLDVRIDVHGFDAGTGIPKTDDYRDCPNLWMDGQFPMDVEMLRERLTQASLHLGLVEDTIPQFVDSAPPPVAFVSFDLDLFSSTRDALEVFATDFERVLPRVFCYFDDIDGLTYSGYNGERLAISEFNAAHGQRKLSPLYGLRFFVPRSQFHAQWPNDMFLLHVFDHPLYNEPDELRKILTIDIEGRGHRDRRSAEAASPNAKIGAIAGARRRDRRTVQHS